MNVNLNDDQHLQSLIQSCVESVDPLQGQDPYWPKWDHVWWQLTLLMEIKALSQLNPSIVARFLTRLDQHYLQHFPLLESEVPPDCNPYGDILCFCALGTVAQIAMISGLNPWQALPWLRDWLSKYQLPDGGYNCDEQAYNGSCKSSIVSTVPMLEAILQGYRLGYLGQEALPLLKQGYDYLIQHRLYQRRSGETIDPQWLKPFFPRFYEYDILRGLQLALDLAQSLNTTPDFAALNPAYEQLTSLFETEAYQPEPWYLASEETMLPTDSEWIRGQKVSVFPLLDYISQPTVAGAFLLTQWQSIKTQWTLFLKRKTNTGFEQHT